VGHHENIRLYTYSELESVTRSESNGDFMVRIRRKAAYVDWSLCTGCGVCQEKCPFKVESSFERGIGPRKVVYTLSPQAVPNKPVIDAINCRYLQSKWDIETGRLPAVDKKGNPAQPRCGACAKFCPTGAVNWNQKDEVFEESVGAIVVATGYDLFPQARLPEYGGGNIPDVIDGLAFERLLAASGPTAGKVLRPSDGKTPKEVVFVQCSGSRDPERGVPYCSKICCMYIAKQAILYKHRVPDGQAYVFYIDVRAGGKGYEEFLNRAQEEDGVIYLRGKVSRLFRDGDKVMVKGADTLSNRTVEIAADLVVLATAVIAHTGSRRVAEMLGLATDENDFFTARNEELDPVVSRMPGVFLAGAALGPKDIPETVAQASGAAAKVLGMFQREKLSAVSVQL
jgi:heterodisulfide reductase subunit A